MTDNRDWHIAIAADGARDALVIAPFDRQPLGHAALRAVVPAFKKGGAGGFAVAHGLTSRVCGATLPLIAAAIDALGGKQYAASGARSWLNASTLGHDVGLGVITHYAPIAAYLASVEAAGHDVAAERACLMTSQQKAGDALGVLVVRALLLKPDTDWPDRIKGKFGVDEPMRVYRMRLTHELAASQVYACDGSPAPAPCDVTTGKPIVYVAAPVEPKAKRTRKAK